MLNVDTSLMLFDVLSVFNAVVVNSDSVEDDRGFVADVRPVMLYSLMLDVVAFSTGAPNTMLQNINIVNDNFATVE